MEHEQVSDSGVKSGYKAGPPLYTTCKQQCFRYQRAGCARSQSMYFATPVATSVNGSV